MRSEKDGIGLLAKLELKSKHSDIKSLYNSDWHYESNSASRYFVVNWGKRKSFARSTEIK